MFVAVPIHASVVKRMSIGFDNVCVEKFEPNGAGAQSQTCNVGYEYSGACKMRDHLL